MLVMLVMLYWFGLLLLGNISDDRDGWVGLWLMKRRWQLLFTYGVKLDTES